MKKHFAVLLLLLCLCLCCTLAASAEGMKEVSTFDEFKAALNDNSISEIQLTTDITFTENVTVNRSVWINLGTHSLLNPEGSTSTYTLTIAQGVTLTLGKDVKNTTDLSKDGKVYVNVVNNGHIQGSTAFYGHVINNKTIAAADYFFGPYTENGENSSTSTLVLDGNLFLWDPIPEGWKIDTNASRIQKEIIRGQTLSVAKDLPTITRNGFTFVWEVTAGNSIDADGKIQITQKTELIAKWTATDTNYYTLSFDGGDYATSTKDSIQVRKGETLLLPDGVSHSAGFGFIGWSTDETGKGSVYAKNDRFTFDGTKDITLYAQYSIITSSDAIYHVNYYLSASDAEPETYDTEPKTFSYRASSGYSDSLPATLKTLEELGASAPEGQQLAGWRVGTMGQTENGLKFQYDPDNTLLKAGQKVTYPGYFNKDSCTLDLLAEYENIPTPTPAPVPTASPAAPTPDIPQTGDSTPLHLWLALAVLSCIGIAAIAAHGKKQRTLFY